MNLYRNIDHDKIQFDFLTPNISTYESVRNEIERCGGNIFQFGINASSLVGKIKLYRRLKVFLCSHKYDVIHINSGVLLFNCVVAAACKKYSAAKIFVHSHSNGGRSASKERLSDLLKSYLVKQADVLLACSKSAAEYMFLKEKSYKTVIFNNGINVDVFRFDSDTRIDLRKELGIESQFVIGHVGRFTYEKNHDFLIDLICSVKKKNSKAVLLLIGEGDLMPTILEKVKKNGVEDSVIFLGPRKDVNRLYQAMDVFVLPSIFEGFGIVNIEAQTAGLKCVISTAVPEEVNITGNVVRLPLENALEKWVDATLNVSGSRKDYSEVVKQVGFDMASSAKKMELLYESAVKQ